MTLHEDEIFKSKQYLLAKTELENGQSIVLLTRDNVARIEAVISLDSNYRRASDVNSIPDTEGGTYIGSSRYWVGKLSELASSGGNLTNESQEGYSNILTSIICSIDNENRTHLNADSVGREAVRGRIIERYPAPVNLIEAVKNNNGQYTLLKIIAEPQMQGENKHYSFATKFCHYCALYLFEGTEDEDMYPIYDAVLGKALPLYAMCYLGEEVLLSAYQYKYREYVKLIDRIRDAAEQRHNERISRNGLDHLIWYYHKGR